MTRSLLTCLALVAVLAACRSGSRDTVDGGVDALSPDAGPDAVAAHTARTSFAKLKGVEPSDVAVVTVDETVWSDSSLGCPRPGENYAQVLTPGYRITVIATDGQEATYHSDMGSDTQAPHVILCAEGAAPAGSVALGGPALELARQDLADRLGAAASDIAVADSFLAPVAELECDDTAPQPPQLSAPRKVILEFHLAAGGETYAYRAWANDIVYCGSVDDLITE